MSFGLTPVQTSPGVAPITTFAQDGDSLLYGDTNGTIYRFSKGQSTVVCQLKTRYPVAVLRSEDIYRDGKREIIAADDNEELYVFSSTGTPIWQKKLSAYRQDIKANATDITVSSLDAGKKMTILVATTGWMAYAFDPDGGLLWKTFTKYHEETKVQAMKRADGEYYVAVGTEYQTPLDVLAANDGRYLWHTWEEMGSEFLSSTNYVGFGLTDMLSLDTGNDGKQDVVFGTLANTVTALDLASGATKWEVNVGDEVTVLQKMKDPTDGEPVLLVATDAGDLFKYSRSGKRLQALNLEAGITDMKVIPYPDHRRDDIVLSMRNGEVVICDDSFRVRAVLAASEDPLMGVSVGQWLDGKAVIYAVSQKGIHTSSYHPFFLRPSRNY